MSAHAEHRAPQTVPGADRIREISLAAWASNQHRAAELTALVGQPGILTSEDVRLAARSITHQLIGSAGTFGHDHVSETAREVSEVLNHTEPSADDQQRLKTLLASITADLEHEPELDL